MSLAKAREKVEGGRLKSMASMASNVRRVEEEEKAPTEEELWRRRMQVRVPGFKLIQLCMLLFGTVMYGYHVDQNPEGGIYSLNFEAGHRTFVIQWDMAQFTIGKNVIFLK